MDGKHVAARGPEDVDEAIERLREAERTDRSTAVERPLERDVSRRQFVRAAGGGLLAPATGVASAGRRPWDYLAYLDGGSQVPPVETGARGLAAFELGGAGAALHYAVYVLNIEDATMAHVHRGRAGKEGPVVAWLYPTSGPRPKPVEGNFGGVLARATLTAGDLVGPLEGMSMGEFVAAIEAGAAYVNVHTAANPGGEIRGQIG